MCDQFITKLMHVSRCYIMWLSCDSFFLQELQLDIPKFLLSRRVKITNENKGQFFIKWYYSVWCSTHWLGDNLSVTIADIDVDEDIPYSFIKVSPCSNDIIINIAVVCFRWRRQNGQQKTIHIYGSHDNNFIEINTGISWPLWGTTFSYWIQTRRPNLFVLDGIWCHGRTMAPDEQEKSVKQICESIKKRCDN